MSTLPINSRNVPSPNEAELKSALQVTVGIVFVMIILFVALLLAFATGTALFFHVGNPVIATILMVILVILLICVSVFMWATGVTYDKIPSINMGKFCESLSGQKDTILSTAAAGGINTKITVPGSSWIANFCRARTS